MNLVEKAINESLDIWNKSLNHPFIKELCDGTLSEERIKKYIIQDSIYLREYAKVFAYGIINSKTKEDVSTFYSMMGFINETEGATRLKYLKKFDLTDSLVDKIEPTKECLNYTNHMLECAKLGKLETMMAVLPCMLSYVHIFENKYKSNPLIINNKYGDLISDYISEYSYNVCKKWSNYTNKIALNIDCEYEKKLIDIFKKSSRCEYEFWNMSYNI